MSLAGCDLTVFSFAFFLRDVGYAKVFKKVA